MAERLSPERLREIKDLLKYESSIAFYSSRAKESMLLMVAEVEQLWSEAKSEPWPLRGGHVNLCAYAAGMGPNCTCPDTPAPAPVESAGDETGEAPSDLKQRVTRAIFALKSPPPSGSEHYRSGWDDGLEAASDAARGCFEGGGRS